jgi:hypothetical protein
MNETWSPWNDEVPSKDINLLVTPRVRLSREGVEYDESVLRMGLGSPSGVASEGKSGDESRLQQRI